MAAMYDVYHGHAGLKTIVECVYGVVDYSRTEETWHRQRSMEWIWMSFSSQSLLGWNYAEHAPSVRSTSTGRLAMSMKSTMTSLMPLSRTSVRAPTIVPPIDPPNRSLDKRDWAKCSN